MSHVDAAVTEMFRSAHMQLLGNACRLEKVFLAALVLETRATGDAACCPLPQNKMQALLLCTHEVSIKCSHKMDNWHKAAMYRHRLNSIRKHEDFLQFSCAGRSIRQQCLIE